MALFEIHPDTARNENLLVVAPDWVLGASEADAFVWSTASDGKMDSWHYDELVKNFGDENFGDVVSRVSLLE